MIETNENGEKIFTTKDGRKFKLEAHEEPCKYDCDTIVDTRKDVGDPDGAEGHCGMCCDAAKKAREARVAPILAAAKAKAEKEAQARAERAKAREEAAREQRISEQAEAFRRAMNP